MAVRVVADDPPVQPQNLLHPEVLGEQPLVQLCVACADPLDGELGQPLARGGRQRLPSAGVGEQ